MAEQPFRRRLMGLPVDLVDLEEAAAICRQVVEDPSRPPLRVITLNPEMALAARNDRMFAACFEGEVLVVPDGIGIVMAGRRRGWPRIVRVPGIELCERLAAEAACSGWPVFLFGGRPGVAEKAAAVLARRHPGLRIAGTAHGYLRPGEEQALVRAVAASGTLLLFAGLGSPRQEIWLARNLAAAGARVGVGVGGSFDVIAGRIPRAPHLWRRLGIEWAYRFLREPRRWRRLLRLPAFFWRAVVLAPRDEEGEEG